MSISRTKVNALVNDDSTNTTGTLLAKQNFVDIYDDIDAFIEGVTGTWTPNLLFGGAAVGMTYGTRTGTYTRVGNIVTVAMRIALTAKGSSTGTATITGLPVACVDLPACVIDCSSGMSGLGGTMYGALQSTTLTLASFSATGRTFMAETNFTNTSDIRLGITYRV